jgi:hypothetical protein
MLLDTRQHWVVLRKTAEMDIFDTSTQSDHVPNVAAQGLTPRLRDAA